ncbi:hypothetical protein ACRALDRAFT_2094746, partial [Sodiomyces alcalophilus JCM 7366]|uniref:uncharacterized protein n=1 Tax=Sodiomyces alcalophilus JCM 7366 TaxID=591952 RepID=UPI0039B4D786
IRYRATLITIRGIGDNVYATREYMLLLFRFRGIYNSTTTIAKFIREVSVIDKLKANMLLGIDYILPE